MSALVRVRRFVSHRRRVLSALLLVVVLAGCGIGNDWPAVPGGPRHPVTVVLIGDSLLFQTVPKLPGAFSWNQVDATIVDSTAGGVGLLDNGIRGRIDATLDQAPSGAIVVYQFSGNCFTCPYAPGSEEFFSAWEAQIWNLLGDARARGQIPIWVSGPPFNPATDAGHAATVARLATDGAGIAHFAGVDVCDWTQALADTSGAFQDTLWYADVFAEPAWHTVRDADGVHLAGDGPTRSAAWTGACVATVVARG